MPVVHGNGLIRALRGEPALGALGDEGRVARGVGGRGAALEVQDVIGDRLEERAVVRDEEDGGVETAQVPLQPQRGLEVQVVGGLVEEQQVGRGGELARQRHAAALAAAQGRERAAARGVRVEAESVQDRVHPRRGPVAALVLEPVQVAVVALEHRRRHRVARLGHARGLLGERALEREQVGEGARGGLPHRRRVAEIAVLVHHRDPQPGGTRHGAARGGQVPADQVEQRRLPGSVAAQDAPALPAVHQEAHVPEQLPVAEAHRDTGHRDQGHGVAARSEEQIGGAGARGRRRTRDCTPENLAGGARGARTRTAPPIRPVANLRVSRLRMVAAA